MGSISGNYTTQKLKFNYKGEGSKRINEGIIIIILINFLANFPL